MSWLYIICMLASPGSEEAHRSSMKTIRNWVGSNTSGMQVKNCTNGCGEMLLADLCWHLSAGCSRVHRLLHRGWIPPHTAVCKELFPSLGIICGSVRWDIYSFWHGREKWEHLKGLICHSLSWEGEKKCITTQVTGLEAPGPGLLCIILMLTWATPLFRAGVRSLLLPFRLKLTCVINWYHR